MAIISYHSLWFGDKCTNVICLCSTVDEPAVGDKVTCLA